MLCFTFLKVPHPQYPNFYVIRIALSAALLKVLVKQDRRITESSPTFFFLPIWYFIKSNHPCRIVSTMG